MTAGANQLVSTGHYQATIDFADRTSLDESAKLIELAIEPLPIDHQTKLAWRQHVRTLQSGFDLEHGKLRPKPERVPITLLRIEFEFFRSTRRHRLRVPPHEVAPLAAKSKMT